ncbi:hypothetical protein JZ751_007018 [Albula glossodonta]|uniref:LisH domain-containing protein n=1 Tax=Albula glossodonta TaxID=121402 RepID=A0A8T2P2L1_9TELE|nr:hypothetical protein JZ751_007018 [Albula glossodonta]
MTSKDRDTTEFQLLHLIYQHLKENGYQKAANVLKKHVPQGEPSAGTTPLYHIYMSWVNAPENAKKRKTSLGDNQSPTKKFRQADPESSTESSGDEADVKISALGKGSAKTESKQAVKTVMTPARKSLPTPTIRKGPESSDSDISDSEDEPDGTQPQIPGNQKSKIPAKVNPGKTASAPKATSEEPSDSESSDESENDQEAPQQNDLETSKAKSVAATPVKSRPASAKPETTESSDSDSESPDEIPPTQETILNLKTKLTVLEQQKAVTASQKLKAITVTSTKAMGMATPNQAKATFKATAEDEESDTTDSSDSEEEALAKPKAVPSTPAKSMAVKTPNQAKATLKATPKTMAPAEDEESDTTDSSDSEEEAPAKPVPAKAASSTPVKPSQSTPSQAKAAPKTPAAGKQAESSDSESSDDSESGEEAPPQKAGPVTPAKVGSVIPSKGTPQATPKASASAEEEESDTTDSSESEEESATSKVAAINKAVPVKQKAMPGGPGTAYKEDSSSSSVDSDSEEETALSKATSVGSSAVSALPTTVPETSSDSSSSEEDASQSLLTPKATPGKPTQKSKKTVGEEVNKKKAPVLSKDNNVIPKTPVATKGVKNSIPATPAEHDSDSDSTNIDLDDLKELTCKVVHAHKEKGGSICDSSSTSKKKSLVSTPSQKKKASKQKSETKSAKAKKRKTAPKLPEAFNKEKMLPAQSPAVPAWRESESDSDSSLDVEKWKKLALRLSDADIAKMEEIDSLSANYSTQVLSDKSQKKKEKPKTKKGKAVGNGKDKASPKKSKPAASRAKKATGTVSESMSTSGAQGNFITLDTKAKSGKRPASALNTSSQGNHESSKKRKKVEEGSTKSSVEKTTAKVRMWRLSQVRHKLRRDNSNFEEFKFKRREQERVLRQARRDQQLVSKRHLQENEEEEGAMDTAASVMSKEQIMELFRRVHHGGEEKVNYLQTLRKALRVPEMQLIFIKLENSMQVLVGLLSGSHAQCQLEAAYCLLELSHSSHPAAGPACLPATPYLLTYLSGQSDKFTRHNLAVVEAVGFVLSQLLQAKEAPSNIVPTVLASGITAHLLATLQPDPQHSMGSAIECAWSLHYLVCSNVGDETLLQQGTVSRCSSLLITLAGAVATGNTEEGVELLVWPLLRSVGNLLCGSRLESLQPQLRDSRLLPALCVLAHAFLQPYPGLARESLWVLNNLTADSSVICSAVLFMNLVPGLIQLLPFSKGINCMVLQVLGNIAHQGTEYCSQLTQAGLLTALCTTLKMDDPHVVTLSLEVLIMILSSNSKMVEDFKKINGLCLLEAIQYNSQGEMRLRASYILDHHMTSCSQVDTPTV